MVVQRPGSRVGPQCHLALILRLPWKRQHLGFILPHIGLVVLLVGCLLSRRYGVEATVAVAERQSKSEAYKSLGQHLELDGQQHFLLAVASDDPKAPEQTPIAVAFTPGPFNWEDYRTSLAWFPWHVAHRDRGVIYDRDGIRLEVLDYLSKSRALEIPSLARASDPFDARRQPARRTRPRSSGSASPRPRTGRKASLRWASDNRSGSSCRASRGCSFG